MRTGGDLADAVRDVRDGVPAEPVGRERLTIAGAAQLGSALISLERAVVRTRPKAIQPRPSVLMPRHGEGGAGELLSVEPEGRPLRRIAALGQCAGHRLRRMVNLNRTRLSHACLFLQLLQSQVSFDATFSI